MKEKSIRFQMNKKSFILIAVLCMGIGFSYLTSNLRITGNTSVSGNSWNIYFTNIQVAEDSVEASVIPTTSGTTTTSLNYTVTLDKPGDFYEFTVDAVNNGTINAMIQNVNMTSLDTDVAKFVSYTATYSDGTPLAQNDVLKKNSTATYKVRVEFKRDISEKDLSEEDISLNLTFGVNYVQSPEQVQSNFVKLVRSSAQSDTGINFGAISSASNGRGLYVMHDTTEDDYPIYYYRGAVTNNNAKFAGFCWKIVRTTETGGTKLIYNGTPNANGQCVNTTGDATQLSTTSGFNANYNSLAYNGYMYGAVHVSKSGSTSTSHKYGATAKYDTNSGTYTLIDIHNGADSTHHYTCFSSSINCVSVNYVYYVSYGTAYYITLTDGKSVEDALLEMQTNTTNSTVKTVIDTWFNNTFKSYFTSNDKDYNNYLEDTVWCNDRSMNTIDVIPDSWVGTSAVNNGWKPNGGSTENYLMYSSYGRIKSGTSKIDCPNKNDSFTVTASSKGNGALTYPVGLLTSDEMVLAGGQNFEQSNTDFYLYSNKDWWSMSPNNVVNDHASVFYAKTAGIVGGNNVANAYGIRPSISVKPTVKIASGGDGTSAHPYEFVVE